jgi:hypothetical protein
MRIWGRDKRGYGQGAPAFRFSQLPPARRGRMLRNLALIFLIVGFLLVLLNPENDGPGMALGLIGVVVWIYALIPTLRGLRDRER